MSSITYSQNNQNPLETQNLSPERQQEIEKRQKEFQENIAPKISFLPDDVLGVMQGKFESTGNIENVINTTLQDRVSDKNLISDLAEYILIERDIPKNFQDTLLSDITKTQEKQAETLEFGNSYIREITTLASKIDSGEQAELPNFSLKYIEEVLEQAEEVRKNGSEKEKAATARNIDEIINAYTFSETSEIDENTENSNNEDDNKSKNTPEKQSESLNTTQSSENNNTNHQKENEIGNQNEKYPIHQENENPEQNPGEENSENIENQAIKNQESLPEYPLLKTKLEQGIIEKEVFDTTLQNLSSGGKENSKYEDQISGLPKDLQNVLINNFDTQSHSFEQNKEENKEKYKQLLTAKGENQKENNSKNSENQEENTIDNLVGENYIEITNASGEILTKKSEIIAIQTATNKTIDGKKINVPDDKKEGYEKTKKIIQNGENIQQMKSALKFIFNIVNQNELYDAKSQEKSKDIITLTEKEKQFVQNMVEKYKKLLQKNITPTLYSDNNVQEFVKNIDEISKKLENGQDITRGEVADIAQIGAEIFPESSITAKDT